jgi:hypothetical protein
MKEDAAGANGKNCIRCEIPPASQSREISKLLTWCSHDLNYCILLKPVTPRRKSMLAVLDCIMQLEIVARW